MWLRDGKVQNHHKDCFFLVPEICIERLRINVLGSEVGSEETLFG
jgi:hypothetical protein